MWQAQYLVKLGGDFSWQAQHFVTFWEIAGARNVALFNTKSSPRSQGEGLRSGECDMTILSSDYPRIVFLLAEALQGVSAEIIYNARSNSYHPPTLPNTAPATQNEAHD